MSAKTCRWSFVAIVAGLTTHLCVSFVPRTTTNLQRHPTTIESTTAATADSDTTSSSMYQNVKGIIFDVDGTLADSWKLGFDATLVVLENNNIPTITEDVYHDHTRYSTPDRLARHAGLLPGDENYNETGQRLGEEFDDLYVGLVSKKTASFYDGIHQLLEEIPSRVALGALTNAAERYAHAVLETNCPELNLSSKEGSSVYSRFHSVRGADTVPKPKPAPDGLFQVCKELGLEPKDCVYIGDSPSDGASAHNAGMPAIGVLWGSHKEESLRNAPFSKLCRSVDELRALLPRKE